MHQQKEDAVGAPSRMPELAASMCRPGPAAARPRGTGNRFSIANFFMWSLPLADLKGLGHLSGGRG